MFLHEEGLENHTISGLTFFLAAISLLNRTFPVGELGRLQETSPPSGRWRVPSCVANSFEFSMKNRECQVCGFSFKNAWFRERSVDRERRSLVVELYHI